MRDDDIAVREKERVGNVALDTDVSWLRIELHRIPVAAHGQNQVDRLTA